MVPLGFVVFIFLGNVGKAVGWQCGKVYEESFWPEEEERLSQV